MIITHPFLFNTIVVLFIAFTSGWIVFVFNGRVITKLESRIADLEREKETAGQLPATKEDQAGKRVGYPLSSTPVIMLSASHKANEM